VTEERVKDRVLAVLRDRRTIVALAAIACYLLLGFFALPALLKWQLREQASERLGHRLEVAEIRFNPLLFRLEARDATLSDPQGRELAGLRRLFVDFELRSVVDLAWNFAQVSIESLRVDVELARDGGSNFDALLSRLAGGEPAPPGPPPRVIVQRLELTDARLTYADRLLETPQVALLEPISLQIDRLSTREGERGRYALSAQTAAGETLEASGEIGLQPFLTDGRLALAGVQVATLARASTRWLAIESPSGHIDLSSRFRVASGAGSQDGASIDMKLDALELGVRGLSFASGGATTELLALDEIALRGVTADLGKREARAESLELRGGRISASIDGDGGLDWMSLLRPAPAAPAEEAAAAPVAGSAPAPAAQTAAVPAGAGAMPWRVAIARVAVAEVGASFSDARSATQAQVQAVALTISPSAEFGAGAPRVTIDAPTLKVDTVRVRSGALDAQLASAEIGAKRLALEPDGDAQALSADELRASAASIAWTPDAAREFVRAERVSAGAQRLRWASGADAPDLSADGLNASLAQASLLGVGDAGALLRLSSAEVTGGALQSRERKLTLQRVELSGVDVKARKEAGGELDWERALAVFGKPDAAKAGAADARVAETPAGSTPWRVVVATAAVDAVSASFEDRTTEPPLAVAVESARARVEGFDSGATADLPVEVAARVVSGGSIEAKGRLRSDGSATELAVKAVDVALSPAQPLLARLAPLRLSKGGVSLDGRLRYGTAAAEGADATQLSYQGGIAIRGLLVEERDSGRPFIGWNAVSSEDVSLTIGPDRLDVGELRVDGLNGRLEIGQDRRLRIVALFRRSAPAEGGRKAGAGTSAARGPAAASSVAVTPPAAAAGERGVSEGKKDEMFPVAIARTRVERSVVEFADLSLRPQFETRMHELQGVVTGLSTDPSRTTKLQLTARVDEYGSAKISGELNLVDPEVFTDVDMVFRNLEISSLSPYSVRFAGYRVAGGKLSVDLQYKIKDSKLLGEHKIVIDKMKLGEKVESPEAVNLPLELAIALLQDSKGVIDVGIPVSGDLSNPQFSFGGIIGKAIGNLITGIVTAPFRALGALLGGGGEGVDAIDFEPGSAALAPPERGKLASVGKILAQRPGLALVVPPVQSPRLDGPALKSLALRTEVAQLSGAKLQAGEDPGPLDVSEPRTRRAVEQLFAKRYSPAVLEALKNRAERADDAFHRSLVEKLMNEQPIPDGALAQLATKRAEAVVGELTSADGVPAGRVSIGEAREAQADTGDTVALKLELSVKK